MREIAVNRCFGGFGLSYAAVMAYAKRKGLTLYAYISARDERGHLDFKKYIPYDGSGENFLCVHYSTETLLANGDLPEAQGYFSPSDIRRDDKDLIAVIKELGAKANGDCAKIKITEIPADVDWEISEYDGSEHVAEKHRTW